MMIVTTQLPYLRLWKKLKPLENLSIFQKDVSILTSKLISKRIILTFLVPVFGTRNCILPVTNAMVVVLSLGIIVTVLS